MTARVPRIALGCLALVAILLTSLAVSADRPAPAKVAPLVVRGVRYAAPSFGIVNGESWDGGRVEAWDIETRKLLWARTIYRVHYQEGLERDVQEVYITKLAVKDGTLLVTTEGRSVFEMDLASGSVRASKLTEPRLEVASATPMTKELPVDRPECRDGSSDAYFFPAGWLAGRTPRFDEDQSRRRWYSKAMRAMAEPSLSCPRKGGDAIRFLWLRTWGRPIAVRVESSNGGAVVSAVELSGAGGYGPGKISRRVRRALTDAERRRLAASLDDLHLFEMPTHDGKDGLDGAQWILEARMGARYHVTDRWSPEDGPYRELCLSMLKLVDLLPSGDGKDRIY